MCGKTVAFDEYNLCVNCLGEIEYVGEKCERCSGFIVNKRCEICRDREFYLTKNIAVAEYSGVIKELLHDFKFNRIRGVYHHFGRIGAEAIRESGVVVDQVTSVPINRLKKSKRGYNQSELIAGDLAGRLKLPYRRMLKEKKASGSQKELGFRDRFINVIDRYEVINPGKIANKKVLIVDDVFTTGATVNECARVLKKEGVVEVFSLTIARAGIKKLEKI
ncbi:MAG: ComF family protein [bacterium]|nr:ComF family protein [bacterium]